MSQGDGLSEILVETEGPGEGASDLSAFEGMGQTIAVVVSLVLDEDLGLVLETAKGPAVDDAVPIALKCRAVLVLVLRLEATVTLGTLHRTGREPGQLLLLVGLPITEPAHRDPLSSPAAVSASRRSARSFAREASSISP
jgi:hypothetical protein